MGSREIRPTEVVPETVATSLELEGNSFHNHSYGRKRLGLYFRDSANGSAALGHSHEGGTIPVDIRGKPITNLSRTGGWLAAFFIFGTEVAERISYFGISVNMVAFMFYVMHRPFTSSANAVNNFLGISQTSSVLGAFIADAYLGRYWTIAISTTIYLTGLTGITICATMSKFVPKQDECDKISLLLGYCEPAKSWQMAYLNTFLYLTGFGAAGIRPCVAAFGADQFDERSKDYKTQLDRFFNFFYMSVTTGAVVAFTLIVYIQMQHGWGSAFGALCIAMGGANIIFYLGTPLYMHRLPGGSPLARVAQVLVAAFRKRSAYLDSRETGSLYEVSGQKSAIKGSGKIAHTDTIRCLDKAALKLKEDEPNPDPWRLCTVTQVEEVKILLRLVPITAHVIMITTVFTEYLTLSVQQAYTLNTKMGHLTLPVTCMPVFPALSIILLLSLYYSVFVPLARRITGHPRGASQLQRMGIGLAISIVSATWAGFFERHRRHYAIKNGYEDSFLTAMPDLSAFWLIIQYCLIGIAEVFCIVGCLEFLYEEAPDAMRSVGTAFVSIAGGLGCFSATILNNIVKSATAKGTGVDKRSWLSDNINTGRFDYFYWLLAGLSIVNFCSFLFTARRYKYRVKPESDMEETVY